MKFAHISDLHLGLRLYEMRMTEEQRYILEEITGLLKEEKPDALLISGDIYDRPVPPEEAVEMLSDFLGRVRALGISIFMISGNHDSPERISFGEKILGLGDVHVAGKYDGKIKKVVKEDKYGRINFFLLPYIKPSYVNAYLEEDKKIRKDPEPAGEKGTDKDSDKGLNLYQRAVEEAIATDPPDTSERNVILAHQFVMGATRSESEEVIVGLVDSIGAEVFDGFDYVALGHLHKPQHIGEKRVRYCGTPLKYSFSEEKNKKSVTFVEMKQKGDIKISANGRDLKKYGSQGQQRTAALSLKLSEIKLVEEETGEKPVLLLDDVLSELDNERQKYLINSLGDNQMFITTTDIIGSVARSLPEGKIFTIRGGEVDMEI